jgi:sec-independent protein translocase protein TatC
MRPKQDAEMPFLDHLEELRWRIIYALATTLVCIGVGLWITLRFDVVAFLAGPILPLLPQHALAFTHPTDKVTIELNVSLTIGLILASPVILYQAWMFVAPALYRTERRIALAVLSAGLVLFVAGAALADIVVVPLALPWLFDFGSSILVPLITAEEYFGFILSLVLTFGLSFELPIVVLALAAFGLVTPQFLARYRRHAVVLIVFIGAFLTPGDLVWTTVALAVPLYFLYELSILASHLVVRHRRKDRLEHSLNDRPIR